MAIPSQEELNAADVAINMMTTPLRKMRDLIRVARNRGTPCNGLMIPLTEDMIQPLIDEYITAKAEVAALFQELP